MFWDDHGLGWPRSWLAVWWSGQLLSWTCAGLAKGKPCHGMAWLRSVPDWAGLNLAWPDSGHVLGCPRSGLAMSGVGLDWEWASAAIS